MRSIQIEVPEGKKAVTIKDSDEGFEVKFVDAIPYEHLPKDCRDIVISVQQAGLHAGLRDSGRKDYLAMFELELLYAARLEGEVIDWNSKRISKFHPYITTTKGLSISLSTETPKPFAFLSANKCEAFIEAHETLLKQASPLLWGFEFKEDK